LLGRYFAVNLGLVAPSLLGLGFILWSWLARQPGFLVPGGVLTGVGAGLLAERWLTSGYAIDRAAFFACFAAGWGSITWFSHIGFRRRVRWPLIPAAVMVAIALFHLGGADFRTFWRTVSPWWPLVLLVLGAWLVWSPGRRK
ncbi:MAG TPA: hypothetical protein VHF69_07640, partial [Candidatus Synoicihabitans sp.]|nr:hypothetical protein [Candidatus Synoicihabitans sp.]